MYIWNAVEGRFRVHTWYVQRVWRGFGGGMYIWNAVGGRFRVHTWYVRRAGQHFRGGMALFVFCIFLKNSNFVSVNYFL